MLFIMIFFYHDLCIFALVVMYLQFCIPLSVFIILLNNLNYSVIIRFFKISSKYLFIYSLQINTFFSESFIIFKRLSFLELYYKIVFFLRVFRRQFYIIRVLQTLKDTFQFTWGIKIPYLSYAVIIFLHNCSLSAFNFSFHWDKYIFVNCFRVLDQKSIFTLSTSI